MFTSTVETQKGAHKLSIIALAVAASLTSNLALAEEATLQDESAEAASEVDRIVVTSSRRAVALQDEGASVVAVDPSDFAKKGIKDISGVIDYSPGVNLTSQGGKGQGSITARGVVQSLYIPVFGIYLDDTPVTSNVPYSEGSNFILDGMLMDIERIEIIKGPQGTLYGATAVGGMMRYISRDPAMDTWRGSVGLDLSQTKEGGFSKTLKGRVSVPLIEDKLGLTIAAYKDDTAGYLDQYDYQDGSLLAEDVNESDTKGYSVDLLYDVTENLSVRLKHIKQKTDYALHSSYVTIESPASDKGVYADYGTTYVPDDNFIDYQVSSATINYETKYGAFTSTSSWVDNHTYNVNDNTPFYGYLIDYYASAYFGLDVTYGDSDVDIYADVSSDKFVQEVRFTSNRMGNFEWLAGLYYAHETSEFYQDLIAVFPDSSGIDDWVLADAEIPNEYTEKAIFADATYYFTDKLDVTAGVRLSDHESILSFNADGLLYGSDESYDNLTVDDKVSTYLISGRYRPNENLSVYTRIASGYRPATSNVPVYNTDGENVAPDMVEADTLWSYELGAKGRFDDYGISYDLSVYHIDWDNFQAQLVENGASYGTNAEGGITVDGFDLQTTFQATESIVLTLSNSYSSSRLNEDEEGLGGLKGDQVPYTPKWSHSLQASYEFDFLDSWYGSFGGGVRYVGEYDNSWPLYAGSNTENEYLIEIDSRVMADLNLSLSNGQYTLGMYVTNLFDNRALKTATTGYNYLTGDVTYYGIFETPRTVGVKLSAEF